MRRMKAIVAIAVAGLLALSACSSTGAPATTAPAGDATSAASTASTNGGGAPVTLEYWLWDSNQVAQYQACADDFTAANPNIKVNITQTGWTDYWNNLTTNLTAGSGPDVFTDHLNYFADFLGKQQIVNLQPYIDKDKVDLGIYFPGLADLWKDKDGNSYGLPKDWDTVAIFYNEKMMKDAGVTTDQLKNLTWNPKDGGTWGKLIAHMTIDQNGKRGDEAGFDKTKIKTYGLFMEGNGAGFSQTQLSMYLFTTGFQFTDKNPWGTKWNFSDQNYKDTLSWWYSLVKKGYMNDLAMSTSMDANATSAYGAGKFAMVQNGDWMISSFKAPEGSKTLFAPSPIGPSGKRASLFNGLTDAITSTSKHPDEAWQWVKWLGSEQCQKHVADAGVVFPAIKSLSDATIAGREKQGLDVSAFMTHVLNGTTFPPPIADHYPDVLAIQQPVMDDILTGKKGVDALDAMNDQINALYK